MRNARAAIAAISTMSLVGALASIGAAQAATTGVGTSQVSTTVANIQLGTNGSLLGVRLLGDDARSTIDTKVTSAAEAFSRFTGLTVSSETVDDVKALSSAPIESKQPGGDATVTSGSVDLSDPAGDGTVPVPPTVLDGTIGLAHLSSEATATQAKSALSATLTDAAVGGSLVSVTGVTSALNTAATTTQSNSSRSVKIDQAVVLELGPLLAGIGLPVTDLPVPTATGLLTTLDIVVPGLGDGSAVQAVIDDLQDQIGDLDGLSALPVGTTVTTVVDTVNTVGGLLGQSTVVDPATVTTITALTGAAQVNALIDQLQGVLGDVLATVLSTLDGAPLLTVDSVDVGVTTKAGDTVANSTHGFTGGVSGIVVGSLAGRSVDVTETAAAVSTKVSDLNDELKAALGGIDPGLEDLVDVSVLKRPTNDVTEANGYITAVDGITALKATVTPPSTLTTIVGTIQGQTSMAEVLLDPVLGAGGQLPTLPKTASMATLGKTLDNDTTPLGDGVTVTLANINGTSNFAPQLAGAGGGGGPGTGTDNDRGLLVATGSNDAIPMTAVAMLLIALGLGFREWIRMPVPARTKE